MDDFLKKLIEINDWNIFCANNSSLIKKIYKEFKCNGCGSQRCDLSLEFVKGCTQFREFVKQKNCVK